MDPYSKAKAATHKAAVNAAATTIGDVPVILQRVLSWINLAYSARQSLETAARFPILLGGSLKDIAQRQWKTQPGNLVSNTWHVLKRCGLLDADATIEDFAAQYLELEPFLCARLARLLS